jgi:DNA-binding NarL/FixJ family response regulator
MSATATRSVICGIDDSIRVLVVDDHPAVLTGLMVAMRYEPGIVPVAGVASAMEAMAEARLSDIDVALLDYHLPDGDGLTLCQRLKSLEHPPRVLVYSAFAGLGLTISARVAGADGLVDKGVATDRLLDAIRAVSRGESEMPPVPPDEMEIATAMLDDEDLPVVAMLAGGTPRSDIATTLKIGTAELDARLRAIFKRLRRRSPRYAPGAH